MAETPPRRPPSTFEPPPWERERFEELRERKQEGPAAGGSEPEATSQRGDATLGAPTSGKARPGQELDDKAVEAMFVQLRAEEPASDGLLKHVGLGFSALVAAVGLVLMVWGLAALRGAGSSGALGLAGASIMLLFGGVFVGLGVWTAVRSLKQQGVL